LVRVILVNNADGQMDMCDSRE